jgi:hypothetical protein
MTTKISCNYGYRLQHLLLLLILRVQSAIVAAMERVKQRERAHPFPSLDSESGPAGIAILRTRQRTDRMIVLYFQGAIKIDTENGG